MPPKRGVGAAAPPARAKQKTAAKAKAGETVAKASAVAGAGKTTNGSAPTAAEAEVTRGPNDLPPLRGSTVALTGELDGMTRIDVEDKLKAAGAKVMGSVSGNTTFLVVGSHLDDGRPVEDTSKYKKYLDIKAKGKKWPTLLYEVQLMSLLGGSAVAPKAAVAAKPVDKAVVAAAASQEPWVDRHAPKGFDELLGNAGSVKKLVEWLRDWDDVVLRGKTKMPRFKPGGGMPDNLNARAALVSGPPGIGKTTACRLVARLHGGYDLLEYNASDARGQKIIQAMAEGIADNRTLSFSSGQGLGASKATAVTRRSVIIMDEVDGMGAGDRGGNAALIKMIKKTKNPIICICNDHGSPKMRSLTFSCYDIRFSRPSKGTIAQRIAEISAAEGLSAEPNALEALAESCGNDVRHVLNQLQVLAASPHYRDAGVGYTDMRDHIRETCKDGTSMLTPFDACKQLLTTSQSQNMTIRDRLDCFFVDQNLVHLLVHENYLNSVMRKPVDAEFLQQCAHSAELFALGDVVSQRIREHQEWNLLPDMGFLSAVYPAKVTCGFVAFPEFPKFLGNYSRASRARRLCLELHAFLRLSTTTDRSQLVRSNYLEILNARALKPLQQEDLDGTVAVLDAYGLQREHLAEHLAELRQHLGKDEDFKLVDPKVKSALTRELNSGGHAVKVVLPGSKKRKAAAPDADDLGAEEDLDAAQGKKQRLGNADAAVAGPEGEEEVDVAADDTAAGKLVKQKKAKARPASKLLENDRAFAASSAKAASSSRETFSVGDLVTVDGLKSTPAFNNQQGEVLRFDDSNGRWTVKLSGGKELALKPSNMHKAASSSREAFSAGDLVTVDGLKSTPAYNNQQGEVLRFDDSNGRWTVKLSGGKELALKPSNMHKAKTSPAAKASGKSKAESSGRGKAGANGAGPTKPQAKAKRKA